MARVRRPPPAATKRRTRATSGAGTPGAADPSGGEAAGRLLFAPRELPPLRPDAAAEDPARYRDWVAAREAERLGAPTGLLPAGRIDVLIAVDRADPALLSACLGSVTGQTSHTWRLSIVAVGETGDALDAVLAESQARWPDRVALRLVPAGVDTASAIGLAFEYSGAPTVLVLGQHDELAPDALSLLTRAIEGASASLRADIAYGDEDEADGTGALSRPVLKPDWSPDLLLSTPYLGRPTVLRRSVVGEAGGVRPSADGDWEHDLLLRVAERATRVAHVAEVLCHRHVRPAPSWGTSGGGVVAAALARRGEEGEVAAGPLPGTWAVHRRAPGRPRVSVLVPFRDGAGFLRTCVDSVTATAGEVDLQVVLVDNGSTDPETQTLVEHLAARPGVAVVRDPRVFNWAALNNEAAEAATGEVLVFLNNDIEAGRAGWLEVLAAQALRPEVAVAGARLLYPGGRVQHAGVVVGIGGAAGHVLAGLEAEEPGYLGMAVLTRNCSAVTGACMAVRREVFDGIGRFDETLGVDLNDIDFCLRAIQRGFHVVYEPLAELVHYESPSRGTSGSVANITRFIDRWRPLIEGGDPFLNPHLTRVDSSCALRGPDEEGWWQRWRSTLDRS
ncbi:MAG: glycosyltransferase [Acidimicrobiales bacterium]